MNWQHSLSPQLGARKDSGYGGLNRRLVINALVAITAGHASYRRAAGHAAGRLLVQADEMGIHVAAMIALRGLELTGSS